MKRPQQVFDLIVGHRNQALQLDRVEVRAVHIRSTYCAGKNLQERDYLNVLMQELGRQ